MTYDAASRLTTVVNGTSRLRRRFGYDAAGQVLSITDEKISGATLSKFTFAYDADGNRTKVQDLAGNLTTYAYDAKGRLTQDATTGPNAHTYNYTYDAVDNRLTSNEGGTVMTQTYDLSGRLTTSIDGSGVTTYTYDANGNLTNVQPPAGNKVTMA